MKKDISYHCPACKKPLTRKPIRYGLPDPEVDHSDVILGGCCADVEKTGSDAENGK